MGALVNFGPGTAVPFLGESEFIVTPDDLEMWIQDESPEGGALSWEEAAMSIVYDVPSDSLYEALLTLIGYAWAEPVQVDATAPIIDPFPPAGGSSSETRNFLRRGLPLCHPKFPFLVCTRVDTWKGIGPRGKEDSTFVQPVMQRGLPIPLFVSAYEVIRITATFTQPKYNIVPDTDSDVSQGNELVRFVYRDLGATTQFLTIDKGNVIFIDGPYAGKTFVAPGYAQPETTEDITLVWTRVPEDYVCDRFGDPIRFIHALQKVNSAEFLGYQPGTLRLDSFNYDRFRMPTLFTDGSTRFWCEIKAHFKFFNPITGPSQLVATFANNSTTLTVSSPGASASPTDWRNSAASVGLGVNISGTGIPGGTTVMAVNTSTFPNTITISQATTAASAGGGNVVTFDRTIFGHLVGPCGINNYYTMLVTQQGNAASGFPAIPPKLRFQQTDFNEMWYPLTADERNPA